MEKKDNTFAKNLLHVDNRKINYSKYHRIQWYTKYQSTKVQNTKLSFENMCCGLDFHYTHRSLSRISYFIITVAEYLTQNYSF